METPQEFPNEEPLARSSDDDTSHDSGDALTASGERDAQKHQLLAWLRTDPRATKPKTAREIAKLSGFPHPMVHKRLPDLKQDGFVIKCRARICTASARARRCVTWRAAYPVEQQEFLARAQAKKRKRGPPAEQLALTLE